MIVMEKKIDEIRSICENLLVRKGISSEEAKTIVDEFIEGELLGKKSHGLQAFPSLVKKLDTLPKKWEIEKETPASALINANGYFGQIVAKEAADLACEKASTTGIAAVGIKNLMTWLRPRTPAKMIADQGLIGLVVNNGGKEAIAPAGGIDPMFGTNPIGVGLPTKDGVVHFDMATSVRAWGEVRVAKALGQKLPEKAFLKKDGSFAEQPDDVYSAVPVGDYKGYALALLIEILTGSLVDMPMGPRGDTGEYRTTLRGAFVIAIDPAHFTNAARFLGENANLMKTITSSRPRAGVDKVRIPGQVSEEKRQAILKKGTLVVDDEIWKNIQELL